MEERVTIRGLHDLTYRQGTSAALGPVPTTTNDAMVSVDTQFSLDGGAHIYVHDKGSWSKGGSYLAREDGAKLSFEDDLGTKRPTVFYRYK
jgi:hypothetical protein